MRTTNKIKLLIIGGPTGTGKTSLAVKIAKKFNGELINADSRQIYQYLDVGTNKGRVARKKNDITIALTGYKKKKNEKQYPAKYKTKMSLPVYGIANIPIHLVSFLTPDEQFNIFKYKQYSTEIIKDIHNRRKLPILVGGSGLYIDALIKDYRLPASAAKENLRKELENLSTVDLKKKLKLISKAAFDSLNESDINNPRRLIRLIEKLSGKQLPVPGETILLDTLFLYPIYKWAALKETINDRAEEMIKTGLIEETKKVLSMGYKKNSVPLQGIGYKDVVRYLDGEISHKECIRLIQTSHRQYARRQKTWFEGKGRGYKLIKVQADEMPLELIAKFLKR